MNRAEAADEQRKSYILLLTSSVTMNSIEEGKYEARQQK